MPSPDDPLARLARAADAIRRETTGGAATGVAHDAFASRDATLTDPDGQGIALDVDAFHVPKVLFRTPSASGDCCTPKLPWGALDIDGILERAAMTKRDELTVYYVDLADLITMRRAGGRPKDVRRNGELLRLSGASSS